MTDRIELRAMVEALEGKERRSAGIIVRLQVELEEEKTWRRSIERERDAALRRASEAERERDAMRPVVEATLRIRAMHNLALEHYSPSVDDSGYYVVDRTRLFALFQSIDRMSTQRELAQNSAIISPAEPRVTATSVSGENAPTFAAESKIPLEQRVADIEALLLYKCIFSNCVPPSMAKVVLQRVKGACTDYEWLPQAEGVINGKE